MKGDFTRSTFRSEKHYSGVRMQQGRVQLDADWNEQVDISAHRTEIEAVDVIGGCGAPMHAAGFSLAGDPIPTIGGGRYYVDGILCENEADVALDKQPDLPVTDLRDLIIPEPGPVQNGRYIAYLDVWQRHITALEDDGIREVALGGPDTTTRTKTVWQVKLLGPVPASVTCANEQQLWGELLDRSREGELSARAEESAAPPNPCEVAAGAGYRRLENQLYRVEIHEVDVNGAIKQVKWSRDNSSIVTRWLDQKNNLSELIVSSIGRDEVLRFAPGQYVEITDDQTELRGKAGPLVKLANAEGQVLTLANGAKMPDKADFPDEVNGRPNNPKVRRWDGVLKNPPTDPDKWNELEDGVQIKFESGKKYHVGDYWLIPARTAKGDVEWPRDTNKKPIPQPRAGIEHHYCKLAILDRTDAGFTVVQDCRKLFPSLTELTYSSCCEVTVGARGQYATLVEAFQRLDGVQDLSLCLLPGVHEIDELSVTGKRTIKLAGNGASASRVHIAKSLDLSATEIILQNLGFDAEDSAGLKLGGERVLATQNTFERVTRWNPHVWSKSFGGSYISGQSVAVDRAGNVVMTGSFTDTANFGGPDLRARGGTDIFLVKFDAAGNHRWSERFGGPLYDGGQSVAVDRNGNVMLIGYFQGKVNFGGEDLEGDSISSLRYDTYLAKFDAAGDHRWSKSFGRIHLDRGDKVPDQSVAVDGAGNVVLTGSFQGTVNFGGENLESTDDNRNIYLAKLDVAGNHRWSKRFEGTLYQSSQSVAVDEAGNIVLAGFFRGTVNFGGEDLITDGDDTDVFLVQFDEKGHHFWSKRFGGTGLDQGLSVAVDGTGNVVLTGYFAGKIDFGGGNLESIGEHPGVYLAKFGEVGHHLWSRRFGGTGSLERLSVAVDGSGNVVLVGSFTGKTNFGGDDLKSMSDATDVLLAQFDAAGNHRWSRRFGGAGGEYGMSLAVDGAGNVVLTGVFAGTFNFGGTHLVSAENGRSIFLVRLNPLPPLVPFIQMYSPWNLHLWSRRFGGTRNNDSRSVAIDGAGNVVLTGHFAGQINFGGADLQSVASGNQAIYLVQFDAAGNHRWSKRFPVTDSGISTSVAVDGAGNVILTGLFRGKVNFGGKDLDSVPDSEFNIFLVQFDVAGNHRWSKRFGGTRGSGSRSVAVDGAGNVILTGSFRGTVTFGRDNLNSTEDSDDIYLVQFDTAGNHRWSKHFGGTWGDLAQGVAADEAGNVVLTGSFFGTINFGGKDLSTGDRRDEMYLAHFDAAGNHRWSKNFIGTAGHFDRSVAVDRAGNVVLTGYFQNKINFGGADLVSTTETLYLVQFDVAGNHRWSKCFGPGQSNGQSVAVDGAGNVMLMGWFMDRVNFGGTDLVSTGNQNICLAQFDAAGNHRWSKSFGGASVQFGQSLAKNGAGDVVLTGYFNGTINFGGTDLVSTADSNDIFLVKLNPPPPQSWVWSQNTLSSLLAETGSSIRPDYALALSALPTRGILTHNTIEGIVELLPELPHRVGREIEDLQFSRGVSLVTADSTLAIDGNDLYRIQSHVPRGVIAGQVLDGTAVACHALTVTNNAFRGAINSFVAQSITLSDNQFLAPAWESKIVALVVAQAGTFSGNLAENREAEIIRPGANAGMRSADGAQLVILRDLGPP